MCIITMCFSSEGLFSFNVNMSFFSLAIAPWVFVKRLILLKQRVSLFIYFFFWLNVIACLSEIDEGYLEFPVYKRQGLMHRGLT